ncbi:MAG: hypothetical protein J7K54_03380 [Candidatus Aenigmarchaeota archaeon]|nr:hypothetical protein [Candidatus Aenigmarchaeota archaeon]
MTSFYNTKRAAFMAALHEVYSNTGVMNVVFKAYTSPLGEVENDRIELPQNENGEYYRIRITQTADGFRAFRKKLQPWWPTIEKEVTFMNRSGSR